jgi:hypothetical protein
LALSAVAVEPAPWAASAAPAADTSSTPATAQPSQPVRLPSLRIWFASSIAGSRLSATSSPAQVGGSGGARFEVVKVQAAACQLDQAHRRIEEERTSSLRRIHTRNTVMLGLIPQVSGTEEIRRNTSRFALPGVFQ